MSHSYAWMSINCTSLEPSLSSITEVSIELRTSKDTSCHYWRIAPLALEDDSFFRGFPVGAVLRVHEKRNPGISLSVEEVAGKHYLYSKEALLHSGVEDFRTLFEVAARPADALRQMEEVLSMSEMPWVPVGHSVSFLRDQFQAWAPRVAEDTKLLDLVNWAAAIDTVPFFKVVAALHPMEGAFTLKNLSQVYGVDWAPDTESKLNCLVSICSFAARGGVDVTQAIHNGLPSEGVL